MHHLDVFPEAFLQLLVAAPPSSHFILRQHHLILIVLSVMALSSLVYKTKQATVHVEHLC